MESRSEKESRMQMASYKIQIITRIKQLLINSVLDEITACGAMIHVYDIEKKLTQ